MSFLRALTEDSLDYSDVKAVCALQVALNREKDVVWIHKLERMIDHVMNGKLVRFDETKKKSIVTCNHNGIMLQLILPV